MKVLVTGGSGFLGRYVIERLVDRGHEVVALARSADAAARVDALRASAIPGDLDDPASVDAAFHAAEADALANVASLGFGHAPTIVSAAEDAGLRRAVFVSTTAIFTALNAGSKTVRVAAEETIQASALDWTIIRPTMIYGDPGDRNIARLLRLLRRTPIVPLPGDGHRLQQPVHAGDVADAIVAAVEREQAIGRAYDVAGPAPISFREVVEQSAEAVGRNPRLVSIPLGPVMAAVRVYERIAPRPRIKAEQLDRLQEDKAFAISAAKEELGYDPRPFSEGVQAEAKLIP